MNNEYIEELREAYKDGRLVPFIGAGLSVPFQIGNWSELIKWIAREFISEGYLDEKYLPGIEGKCDEFEYLLAIDDIKRFGRVGDRKFNDKDIQAKVANKTRKSMEVDSDNINHNYTDLAKMNFKNIITTNYDLLLHKYLNQDKEEPIIFHKAEINTQKLLKKTNLDIWHLHGNYKEEESIVISKEMYEDVYKRDNFKNMFNVFKNTGVLLILGFSMKDEYIRRILKQSAGCDATHYIVLDNPDDSFIEELEHEFGNVKVITYNSEEKSHIKSIREILNLICAEKVEKNNIINKIEELEGIIKNIDDDKEVIKALTDKLSEVKVNSQFSKYKICFVGMAGAGKSTLISSMINMMKKNCEGEKIEELLLLKVGSGNTTVCEVEIMQTINQTNIRIQGMEHNEINGYIKSFGDYINGVFDMPLSHEEINLMENMCGLKGYDEEDICNEIKDSGKSIKEYLEEKIDYKNRVQKSIFFEKDDNLEVWIRDNFKCINDGLNKKIPLPSKIIININKKDLDLELPNCIESIIDTRGIGGSGREDINEYMKAENVLTIFCDEVNAIGNKPNIMKLLSSSLTSEENFKKDRVVFLGIDKNNNLKNEEIIEEKIKKIKKDFNKWKINFNEKNIIFYNSLAGVETDIEYREGRSGKKFPVEKITKINNTIMKETREEFRSDIKRILKNKDEKMAIEYIEIEKIINEYIEKRESKPITEIKDYIEVLSESKTKCNVANIKDIFWEELNSEHASSLRGAVNWRGNGNNLNLYGEFKYAVGKCFNDTNKNEKEIVIERAQEIFKYNNEYMEIIIETINTEYKKYYEKYRNQFSNIFFERVYKSDVWSVIGRYWGMGYNYKVAVCNEVINMLDTHGVIEEIDLSRVNKEFWDTVINYMKSLLKDF
jgi:ABC-type phosphate transport system ATPase subunit